MADLNSITVTGRLTRDATVQALQSGKSVVKFAIANNTGFGQYARTQFFNVESWSTSEGLLPYLKKGKNIGVTGTLENKSYQGQDGQMHDSWTITARGSLILLHDAQKDTGNKVAPADNYVDDNYTSF